MQKKYFDFTGQVAIVTGCSTGLGVQMAKALANQGWNIVATARREDLLKEVCNEIKKPIQSWSNTNKMWYGRY